MTKDTGGPAFPQPDLSGYGMGPLESPDGQYQMQGMTLRQYAAIKLRVPDSGTDWLDDMIREGRCMDYAGQALAGLLANPNLNVHQHENPQKEIATGAYIFADAMIAEQSK
jgi:hypothetical protein